MTPRRGILLASSLLFASLAVAERGLHDARARALPTDGAQWIWAEGAWEKRAAPTGFLAACDFTPGPEVTRARVALLADEEYLLRVNARLVGSNRYRPQAALDVYEIGDLLEPGSNRLVVELRSARGAGGLIAVVEAGGERLCPTGPEWRIFRRRSAGVVRGSAPVSAGEAPRLWGWSPTGRWGSPAVGEPRPRLDERPAPRPLRAVSSRTLVEPREGAPARLVAYDWGEEVYGFVRVEFGGSMPVALLYLGAEPPDPRERPADAVLVTLEGEDRWRSATPARFRYAVLAGAMRVKSIEVLPAGAAQVAWYPPTPPAGGLLGISPPPLRAPVEDEIRRQLEGFAGFTRREEP